ncbi:IS6 family transposase [Alkalibacter rhizosphaerae]|uniref:IS6 family transposase n=1 Tax=Alkalibacter rhizosphaerae TaxID=2815577 RepID=A0A974XGQ9_9FIRM|nr:IS6 family transposase [Alkalibacter rhizosphaerae]QSX09508.1 IS6 family transposase [Alkalibacter rhizosphaerae]
MTENLFKWKHYESGIIVLCIRWYLEYPLSYRMLVEMMAERGLKVTHTTIMRWVHQYSPILDERIRNRVKKTKDSWRMDETYLKIKGKNAYLYRAVDSDGNTVDFYVSENRDKNAARKFFKKSVKAPHNQQRRVITTDKYGATEIAILEEIYYGSLSCKTQYRMTKYLNNIIEQDHRFIKKKINPMLGFHSYESALKTICGIEIMHMIRKGQVEGIQCVHSEVSVINEVLGIGA